MPAPPRYILDTNIILAYIRKSILGAWIEAEYTLRSSMQTPLISIVTEGEIRSLALQRSWGSAIQREMQGLLNHFVIVDLSFPGVVSAYAQIDYFSRQSGHRMGKNDLWIAATAQAAGAVLLTTDVDFSHLKSHQVNVRWIDRQSHV